MYIYIIYANVNQEFICENKSRKQELYNQRIYISQNQRLPEMMRGHICGFVPKTCVTNVVSPSRHMALY